MNTRNITRKSRMKITGIILGLLLVFFGLSFIPTFFIRTPGMNGLKGQYVTVYYEQEKEAALDIFLLAEKESDRIAQALGFTTSQDVCIYVYDRQSVFQTKKYGWIGLLLNLDWYIGDNRQTNVLVTSPANPGTVHGYDGTKEVAIHEMVHAYNSIINKRMPLWINEGLALYLTDESPPRDLYTTSQFVPSLK